MNANNGWFDSDFSSSDAGAFGTSAGGDGFFDDGSSAPQKQQRNGGGGLHIPLALQLLGYMNPVFKGQKISRYRTFGEINKMMDEP